MFNRIKYTLTLVLSGVTYIASLAQQPGKGTFTNLGPQTFTKMIQGSTFAEDSLGNLMVYTVVRGEPAHLLGYDVTTKALLVDLPLPNADGVWEMAFCSNGFLYIPGAGGTLFRHRVGTQEVTDLGRVLPGETYVWSVTAGKDGEIFGATYPGCRVFRYHPADGFSDVIGGPLVAGENYVRSVVFNPHTGLLYAGIGAHAHLVEINPITKTQTEILPEAYRHKEFAYTLRLIPDATDDAADRLLITLTPGRNTLVLNLSTGQVEQDIEHLDINALAHHADKTIATSNNQLIAFDIKQPFSRRDVLATKLGRAVAIHEKNGLVYVLTAGGELVTIQSGNNQHQIDALNISPQPIPINALYLGPDGRVWMGGYLAGGHAAYHPASGHTTAYEGLDQTEGMTAYGRSLIFGIYPKGRFYQYDVDNDWDDGGTNPAFIGQMDGQSRSFALLAIPNQGKVFAGMVPDYGKLGGDFICYDVKRDQLTSFGNIVPNQSIISLAQSSELVVGGTSISGGLGIKPTANEAVLFVWDVKQSKIVHQCTPVDGAPAIMGLMQGPDGYIWGIADGILFIYDPLQNTVRSRHRIYDAQPFTSHIWRGAHLVNHPSGMVYGTGKDEFFSINPETKEKTVLKEGASLLILGENGNLYFRDQTDLWKYKP